MSKRRSSFGERARWARGFTMDQLCLNSHTEPIDPEDFYKVGLGDPNSYEPLLPPGLSALSLAELHDIAVAPFEASKTRALGWRNLELFCSLVSSIGVARAVWLGGSFVASKVSPRDVDLVVVLDVERQRTAEADLWAQLMSPERKAQLEAFGLDFTCFIEDDWTLRTFHLGRLGFDRNGRARGIATLPMSEDHR